MHLDHSFTVPAGVDEVWRLLMDANRSARCLPNAAIDSIDAGEIAGSMKVKLGPLNLTYRGTARLAERDDDAHRAVVEAVGSDERTDSTANLRAVATMTEADGKTTVRVGSELELSGKPAQFSQHVMEDVGGKLLGQFADALRRTLAGVDPEQATAATKKTATKTATTNATKAAAKKAAGGAAKKTAAKKSAAKKVAATRNTATKSAPAKPAAKKTAAKKAAATSSAPATPSFATPGGLPAAPTLEDVPSVNGHASRPTTAVATARSGLRIALHQVASPTTAKRVLPVAAPVAIGLVVFWAVRKRNGTLRDGR